MTNNLTSLIISDVSPFILKYLTVYDIYTLQNSIPNINIPILKCKKKIFNSFFSELNFNEKQFFFERFDNKYNKYIQLMYRFPFHNIYGYENMAKSFKSMYHSSIKDREYMLRRELHIYGVPLREDSIFGNSYIFKWTLAPIDEVVNIIRLTNFLFSWDYVIWNHFHAELEDHMYKMCIYNNTSWKDALESVIFSKYNISYINNVSSLL